MKVFVAGASGAIGRPLVRQLVAAGHEVTGTTRREERAEAIRAAGATAVVCDVFDAAALEAAVDGGARPRSSSTQLTSLPEESTTAQEDPSTRRPTGCASEGDAQPDRGRAGGRRAAATSPQSIAFLYAPEGDWVKDEDAPPFDRRARRPSARAVEAMVATSSEVLGSRGDRGLVLRYGQFYGPGTYYAADGGRSAEEVREAPLPDRRRGHRHLLLHPRRGRRRARRSPRSTAARRASTTSSTTSPAPHARVAAGLRRGARREAAAPRARSGSRSWSPARSPSNGGRRCAAPRTRRRSASWAGSRATRAGARASARRSADARRPSRIRGVADLDAAKSTLLAELREHSLVIGEVTLSSGAVAQYYVDARRALLRPAGFLAAGELIAAAAVEAGGERRRRPGDGGDPARLRGDRGRRRARAWSASSSAASARSTACSAGSRARSSPAPAASSSRTR